MRRARPARSALVCLVAAMVAATPTPAPAAGKPRAVLKRPAGEWQPARGAGYLAWERNTTRRPNHYDVYARANGRRMFRVNALGTGAAGGGIDGIRLVYQQWRGRQSDIKLYNLRERRRTDPPRGVNSAAWEYWPSMSGRWILFGRRRGSADRRVVLFDRMTGTAKTLARTRSPESFAAPGQVNGNWVVWWRCTPATACNVFRLNLHTGTKIQVPNPGRFQRAPSVTREGTVFFVRSGSRCGTSVRLLRFAPGARAKSLAELPPDHDINDTYAYAPRAEGTKLFYERSKCGEATGSDIWRVAHPRLVPLDVTARGAGGGTVTSSPEGVVCGGDCLHPFRAGTVVTLRASAESSSNFTGWGGACSGHAPTCALTMAQARSVTAFFDPASSFSLSVTRRGDGRGQVTSKPAGISCGNDCWQSYSAGTPVTLTAEARRGSSFVEWRGACSGRGRCALTIDRVRSVVAVFKRKPRSSAAAVPAYVRLHGS